jgi:hypothetical protein
MLGGWLEITVYRRGRGLQIFSTIVYFWQLDFNLGVMVMGGTHRWSSWPIVILFYCSDTHEWSCWPCEELCYCSNTHGSSSGGSYCIVYSCSTHKWSSRPIVLCYCIGTPKWSITAVVHTSDPTGPSVAYFLY